MARLPNVNRDELKPEDQQYFDEIVGSRGSVRGPYGILLHSPQLAARVAHTGTFVRFEFDVPEALKELVIITTAREITSQYEFSAHARLAREARATNPSVPKSPPAIPRTASVQRCMDWPDSIRVSR